MRPLTNRLLGVGLEPIVVGQSRAVGTPRRNSRPGTGGSERGSDGSPGSPSPIPNRLRRDHARASTPRPSTGCRCHRDGPGDGRATGGAPPDPSSSARTPHGRRARRRSRQPAAHLAPNVEKLIIERDPPGWPGRARHAGRGQLATLHVNLGSTPESGSFGRHQAQGVIQQAGRLGEIAQLQAHEAAPPGRPGHPDDGPDRTHIPGPLLRYDGPSGAIPPGRVGPGRARDRARRASR